MKKTFVKPQATTMPMQAETILNGSVSLGTTGTTGNMAEQGYTMVAGAKQTANGFNWN